jgi:hypothetical protein
MFKKVLKVSIIVILAGLVLGFTVLSWVYEACNSPDSERIQHGMPCRAVSMVMVPHTSKREIICPDGSLWVSQSTCWIREQRGPE